MDKDALIDTLQKTIATQTVLLEKLTQQVEELLRKLYGKKSEKQKSPPADNDPPSAPTKRKEKNTSEDK